MQPLENLINIISSVKKHLEDTNMKSPRSVLKFYIYLLRYTRKEKFKEEKFDKLYMGCKSSLFELIHDGKLIFDSKSKEQEWFAKIDSLKELVSDSILNGPKNNLLYYLDRGAKISEFNENELITYATKYIEIIGLNEFQNFNGSLDQNLVKHDIERLKGVLPHKIFIRVYIILMGSKVGRLSSIQDHYLKEYLTEKWGVFQGYYNCSGITIPKVDFIGWSPFPNKQGEFNGEEIIIYEMDDIVVYHEMVHYCQYQRKPWERRNLFEQTSEELDYKLKREKEAYFVSAKIVGKPISESKAEELAWGSVRGIGV